MPQRYATDADLLALAPTITVASTTRDAYRSLAERWIDVTAWGESASHGHALLTLHLLAVSGIAGVPGAGAQVASRTIGRLSVSYQAGAPSDDELASTRWGAMYASLRKTIVTIGATGGGTVQYPASFGVVGRGWRR